MTDNRQQNRNGEGTAGFYRQGRPARPMAHLASAEEIFAPKRNASRPTHRQHSTEKASFTLPPVPSPPARSLSLKQSAARQGDPNLDKMVTVVDSSGAVLAYVPTDMGQETAQAHAALIAEAPRLLDLVRFGASKISEQGNPEAIAAFAAYCREIVKRVDDVIGAEPSQAMTGSVDVLNGKLASSPQDINPFSESLLAFTKDHGQKTDT